MIVLLDVMCICNFKLHKKFEGDSVLRTYQLFSDYFIKKSFLLSNSYICINKHDCICYCTLIVIACGFCQYIFTTISSFNKQKVNFLSRYVSLQNHKIFVHSLKIHLQGDYYIWQYHHLFWSWSFLSQRQQNLCW